MEIKDCFRCGQECHLGEDHGVHTEWSSYWVECMAVECNIEGKRLDTADEAVRWWNTRI